MNLEPNDMHRYAPAVIGSLSAALLMAARGQWKLGVALALPGAAASYYGAPWLADALGAPLALMGFLTGLFAMAAVVKVMDELDRFELTRLLTRWIAKMLGLPDEGGK